MPPRARCKHWALFGVASAVGALAACSDTSNAFEPSLPPAAVVSAFGGQTGSDQIGGVPRGGPTTIDPDEETTLGFSGNEVAALFTRDVELLASDATYGAKLQLSDIEDIQYRSVAEDNEDGLQPGQYLTLNGKLHLSVPHAEFDFTVPTYVVARSLDEVIALGYRPNGDLGVLARELRDDETLRVTIAIAQGQLTGWLGAWDIDADTVRAIGELKEPF